MRRSLALAVLAFLAAPAVAEDWDLCTNRPGLASDGCVLPLGAIQLEASVAEWSLDRRDGVRSSELAIMPLYLRAGVAPGLEANVAWSPYVRIEERDSSGRSSVAGAGDLSLGLKARLTPDDNPIRLAIQPQVTLPVGHRAVGDGDWSASVAAPFDTGLTDTLSLAVSPQFNWLADSDGRGHHPGLAIAASLGIAASDRLSFALDVAHEAAFDPAGTARATAAGVSAAWMATSRLQLDIEVGTGLGGEAPDLTLISGFAIRL
jgi:hypothetical protein